MSSILAALALALSAAPPAAPPAPSTAAFPPPARALAPAAERARRALIARHGERERPRVERGVAQVAALNAPLYLPSYPVGQLVAAQLEEHLAARPAGTSLGDELERMTTFGALTPDLWMRNATGAPLSAAPLLRAAARALEGR